MNSAPWSNFHHSPFTLEDKLFPTAEHWIQYTKACYFHDDTRANAILACETALEAKRVGYQVAEFGPKLWNDNGYEICYQGIKAKFDRNADLYKMLKTTSPKLLIESSTDKTWGTGVSIRDSCMLN